MTLPRSGQFQKNSEETLESEHFSSRSKTFRNRYRNNTGLDVESIDAQSRLRNARTVQAASLRMVPGVRMPVNGLPLQLSWAAAHISHIVRIRGHDQAP